MLTTPAPPPPPPPPAKPSSPGTIPSKQETSTRVPMTSLSSSGLSNGGDVKTEPQVEAIRTLSAPTSGSGSGSGSGSTEIATAAGTSETMDAPKPVARTPTMTPALLTKQGPTPPAPAPASASAPAPASASAPAPAPAPLSSLPPVVIPTETPVDASYSQVVEIEDDPVSGPMDPLSHLSTIFDKIRRQVIEWGEDANWKIDVFLLPNDEPGSASGEAPTPPAPLFPPAAHHTPAHPHARSNAPPHHYSPSPQPPHGSYPPPSTSRHGPPPHYGPPPHPPPFSGPPNRRAPPPPRDQLSSARGLPATERPGTENPSFVLQPPPSDLPGEDNPASLVDDTINAMSEVDAKKMLSVAVRQIREQQTTIAETAQSFEAIQRHSAQRERDLTLRLEAEKAVMERDAAVLAQKWKESSASLLERDNEAGGSNDSNNSNNNNNKRSTRGDVRDIFMQMEAEKAQITKRNNDRRKRVDEQVYPLKGASDQAAFSRSDCSRPNHNHRHRHVHYHRHHHRHMTLTRRGDTFASGADSLDNLATLAAQVLTGEPLVLAKKAHIPVKRQLPLPEDVIVIEDTPEAVDSTEMLVDEKSLPVKDEGLSLRPVVFERQPSPVDVESEDEAEVESSRERGGGGDARETRSSAIPSGPARSMARTMAGQTSATTTTTRGSAYNTNLRSNAMTSFSSSTRGAGASFSRSTQEMKHGISSSSLGRDRQASKHRRI
ncbi:hypothetical protein EMPS_10240 [Entomortierella parvispora]|uniref:Uncharacterized protein n=1 Tax=Entomortierella parvispora TaxID=205924 RepID=A0A9P3HJQ3_9FUNG|nr:hypothetical protein EMPS_10240 [Entomortierella parvispora]